MNDAKEIEIINKILDGDAEAYRYFIKKYKNGAYNLAYRIIRNKEDAQECVSDSFIKAFKALNKFDTRTKFFTWFYKITYNSAISYKRKKRNIFDDINDCHYLKEESSIGRSDFIIEADEKNALLNLALESLDQESRAIVVFHYLEELKIEEISEILEMNINTIKSKLFRARKKMNETISRFQKQEERVNS
jgi:RNA polymerase sigma-70 factor (ECF subfamily)